MRIRVATIVVLGVAALMAAPAAAQFDGPVLTDYRSRLVGVVTSESGGPTLASGDQIAAIYNDAVVGLQTFNPSGGTTQVNLTIYGDNPNTPTKEGPAVGDVVTFQFYDDSTGMTRSNVQALNLSGEVSIVRFQGEFIDTDIPLPPDLLVPVQEFNLRLTVNDNSTGGGGDGDGGGTGQGDPDVNNDGVVDQRDVALVLRVVVGNSRSVTATQRARADVNNDGVVTTSDAVLVYRAK